MAAERVASHGNVDQVQRSLFATGDIARDNDHAHARAPERHAVLHAAYNRIRQIETIAKRRKLALQAGWDQELLTLELGELMLDGFDVSVTGFGELELVALFAEKTTGLWPPFSPHPRLHRGGFGEADPGLLRHLRRLTALLL